jgi:alpha-glucosidase
VFTVAEAYTPRQPEVLLEYQNDEEFHLVFSFDLMLAPWNVRDLHESVDATLRALGPHGLTPTWTLNNHDAQRAVTRYGRADAADPESWTGNNLVYTGAPVDLAVGDRRARAMALFALALPGTFYLYQGEELGLPEVLDLPDSARQDPIFFRTEGRELGRDGCRVPLPWTTDCSTSFGFSTGETAPWMPQPASWGSYAADQQDGGEASMLELYRRALGVRRRHPDLRDAALEWVVVEHPSVIGYRRGEITVLLNVGSEAVEVEALVGADQRLVVGSDPASAATTLAPDAAAWLAAAP